MNTNPQCGQKLLIFDQAQDIPVIKIATDLCGRIEYTIWSMVSVWAAQYIVLLSCILYLNINILYHYMLYIIITPIILNVLAKSIP